MKYILIIFALIIFRGSADCQTVKIDSVVNVYERRYREVLNKSDTVVLNLLKLKINDNCNLIDSIFLSKEYSYNFLSELTKNVLELDCCYSKLLDKVSLAVYSESASDLRYPILEGINSTEVTKDNVINYLKKSEYLADCLFLTSKDLFYLQILSHFLDKNAGLDSDKIAKSENDCKKANLLIMRSIIDRFYGR